MLRRRFKNDQKAQVLLEYTIILGAVVFIVFAMGGMIKRGTQGMIMVVADQMGTQQNSDQAFNVVVGGYLIESGTAARTFSDKIKNEYIGEIKYTFDDTTSTKSNTLVDLGFEESLQ